MRFRTACLIGSALAMFGCRKIWGFEDPVSQSDAGGPDAGGLDAGGPDADASDLACSTHAECNERFWDGPYVCRQGSCLDLTTPTCPIVLGSEYLNDGLDPVVLGAFSVVEATHPLSHPVTLNYELALKDFVRSGGLLLGDKAMLPLLVVCQGLPQTVEDFDASIDHLVDTLHVPGIVVAVEQPNLVHLLQRVLVDKGIPVFFVNAQASDSSVTTIQDEGLLWNMLPGPADLGPAYVKLVERVEAHLNPQPDAGSPPPLRLALVTTPAHRYLDDLGNLLRTGLTINGKPLLDQSGTEYMAVALPSYDLNSNADFSSAIQALREFKPHVIVSAADYGFLTDVLPSLEQGWDQIANGQAPPFYVLSPYENAPSTIQGMLKTNPALRERLVGVNFAAAADSTLYDLYIDRFRAEYPNAANYEGTENYYDAAYWLFYAAVAADGHRELDGPGLASGITRLLSGPRFDVGPTQIAEASRYLHGDAGPSIALYGTLGPPDFDSPEGTRHGTGSVWCFDANLQIRYDVLRYDAVSQDLTGSFPCFDL